MGGCSQCVGLGHRHSIPCAIDEKVDKIKKVDKFLKLFFLFEFVFFPFFPFFPFFSILFFFSKIAMSGRMRSQMLKVNASNDLFPPKKKFSGKPKKVQTIKNVPQIQSIPSNIKSVNRYHCLNEENFPVNDGIALLLAAAEWLEQDEKISFQNGGIPIEIKEIQIKQTQPQPQPIHLTPEQYSILVEMGIYEIKVTNGTWSDSGNLAYPGSKKRNAVIGSLASRYPQSRIFAMGPVSTHSKYYSKSKTNQNGWILEKMQRQCVNNVFGMDKKQLKQISPVNEKGKPVCRSENILGNINGCIFNMHGIATEQGWSVLLSRIKEFVERK